MKAYIQHKRGNKIHIIRETRFVETIETMCGNWYTPPMSFTPDLRGEREEDVVCRECRCKAAKAAGKKLYNEPTLRHGLSQAKKDKVHKALKEYQERQRMEAWNKAAREATR